MSRHLEGGGSEHGPAAKKFSPFSDTPAGQPRPFTVMTPETDGPRMRSHVVIDAEPIARRPESGYADVVSFPKPPTGTEEDKSGNARRFLTETRTLLGVLGSYYQSGREAFWSWSRGERLGPVKISSNLIPPEQTPAPTVVTAKPDTEAAPDPDAAAGKSPVVLPNTDTPSRNRRKPKEYASWPPGAHIERRTEQELDERRYGFKFWRRIEVEFKGPDPEEDNMFTKMMGEVGVNPGTNLDTTLLTPYDDEFYFAVVAEPFAPEDVRGLKQRAEEATDFANDRKEGSDAMAKGAETYGHLSKELERDLAQGRFRRPAILVGVKEPHHLDAVAGYVASGSTTELPYSVRVNRQFYGSFEDAVADRPSDPPPDSGIYAAPEADAASTSGSASALAEILDVREAGVSAQILSRFIPRPHGELKEVSEHSRERYAVNTGFERDYRENPDDYINLGVIEDNDGKGVNPLIIPRKNLDKHVGFWGATGSGKTRALELFTLAVATGRSGELTAEDIASIREGKELRKGADRSPVIIIDPKGTKEGRPSLAQRLAEKLSPYGIPVTEFNPGNQDLKNFKDNPCDPGDVPLPDYLDDLIDIMANAFGSKPGEDDNISAEVTTRFLNDLFLGKLGDFYELHRRFGYSIKTGEPRVPGSNPSHPTLWDAIHVGKEAVETQGYVGEATNIGPFFVQRLHQIVQGKSGAVFDTEAGGQVDYEKMFGPDAGVTVIDISKLNAKDQALVMGLVLIRNNAYLKTHPEAKTQLVIDEINRLVGPGPLGERIIRLFALNREFGGSVVGAGQAPGQVPKELLENMNTHLAMRIKGEDGTDALKKPLRMTDAQLDELTTYQGQEIAMLTEGMNHPVRGYTRDTGTLPTGDATVQPPEGKFRDTSPAEQRFTDKEKIKLMETLDDTLEGGRLLGLVDTITAAVMIGGTTVRIDYDKLENNGYTHFHTIAGRSVPNSPDSQTVLTREERDFLVKVAVKRAVYSRSQTLLRPDVPMDEFAAYVEDQVNATLDDTVSKGTQYDRKYMVPKFDVMPLKSEFYDMLARAAEQGLDQKELPRHPDSDTRLMRTFGEIPGDSLLEQLYFINDSHETTFPVFFARNPHTGNYLIDRAIGIKPTGSSIKKAVDDHEEAKWMQEYKDFLWELDIDSGLKATLYNELSTHITSDVDKRNARRERNAPPPPPRDETTGQALTALTAIFTKMTEGQPVSPSAPAPLPQPQRTEHYGESGYY